MVEQLLDVFGGLLVANYSYCDAENTEQVLAAIEPRTSLDYLRSLDALDQLPHIVHIDKLAFWFDIHPIFAAQIQGKPASAEQKTAYKAHHALSQSLSSLQETAILHQLEQAVPSVRFSAECEPPLPGLRAVYEEIDAAILVFADADAVDTLSQEMVEDAFGRKFSTHHITTNTLLPLLAQYDMAVPFAIDRFRHSWGANPIPALNISTESLLKNAAQTLFRLHTTEFPHALIQADENDFGKLIHDVQNRLLKISFQFELLSMIYELPEVNAPRLSAERSLPHETRLQNINEHIRDWLALYQNLLQTVASE